MITHKIGIGDKSTEGTSNKFQIPALELVNYAKSIFIHNLINNKIDCPEI